MARIYRTTLRCASRSPKPLPFADKGNVQQFWCRMAAGGHTPAIASVPILKLPKQNCTSLGRLSRAGDANVAKPPLSGQLRGVEGSAGIIFAPGAAAYSVARSRQYADLRMRSPAEMKEAANCGGLIDVWSGIRNYEPRTHMAKTVTINSAANVTRAIFRKS